MRAGQSVWWWRRPEGPAEPATVTAVSGSGVSGLKILDLRVGAKILTGVRHVTDAGGSSGWRLEACDPVVVPEPVKIDAWDWEGGARETPTHTPKGRHHESRD